MVEFKERYGDRLVARENGVIVGMIWKSENGCSKPYRLMTWETGRGTSRRFKTLESAKRRAEELLKGGDAGCGR